VKFFLTHGHARDRGKSGPGPMMQTAVTETAKWAQHELWMPNTEPPITDGIEVSEYLKALNNVRNTMDHSVAIKLTAETTLEDLQLAKDIGVSRVKIYPPMVTTNSDLNLDPKWFEKLLPAIELAVETGFVICIHCEEPGKHDTYDREKIFRDQRLLVLVDRFPGAKINVEHISTKSVLDWVKTQRDNVTGGITLHHLLLNRTDVIEGPVSNGNPGMNVHNHCRPPAGREENRIALLDVALNADKEEYRKFHFGPDSAPHRINAKEECGCAGCFTAPVLGSLTVELFEKHNKLWHDDSFTLYHPSFYAFTVGNGARYFGVAPKIDSFVLKKEEWTVPDLIGGVRPFWSGKTISWSPVEV
jgi:dihydroorotase